MHLSVEHGTSATAARRILRRATFAGLNRDDVSHQASSRTRRSRGGIILIGLLVSTTACHQETLTFDPPLDQTLDTQLQNEITGWGVVVPILPVPAQDPALVELGRALFFEKELSGNRDMSCATCHEPDAHLTDGLSLAIGTGGLGQGAGRHLGLGRRFVPRNAPSLLNLGLTFPYLFWEGRLAQWGPGAVIDTALGVKFPPGLSNLLAAQAMLPVLNRTEMRGESGDRDVSGTANELATLADKDADGIWSAVMTRLLRITSYVDKFTAAYPGVPQTALSFKHAANALAAFELAAFTKTNSPFDRFLARDTRAMSDAAKRGGVLFFGSARCAQCHNGPLLGGQQFANIGVPQIGPGMGAAAPLDVGRGELPQQGQFYRFAFRVQPLRNVELTAPYMHDGAYPTLEAVVSHYSNADSALHHYDVTQIDASLRGLYHGDAATIADIMKTLDSRIREPIHLAPSQQSDLVAFLKSLTDPAARSLGGVVP